MVRAWYMDGDTNVDQRQPHLKSDSDIVSLDRLSSIGILHYKFDPTDWSKNEKLTSLRDERGYNYHDELNLTPETFGDAYQAKLKAFFTEHLHDDEEIRFILNGSGYFDVRDRDEKWIRIEVKGGDLVILPSGIYHRFTLDANNFIRVIRMFKGEPVWTAHNRPSDERTSRCNYKNSLTTGVFA